MAFDCCDNNNWTHRYFGHNKFRKVRAFDKFLHFLGAFAKLRKTTISFMSVRLSAWKSRLPLDRFSRKLIWIFGKTRENSSFIKIWQEYRVLCVKTNVHFWSYLAQFFLEWNMFQTKSAEGIKTRNLRSITFFFENRAVDKITWKKYCRLGQAHAHCMLDNLGYKHTHTICNTYCFSTATMVAQKRLNVTLFVHFLSCFLTVIRRGTREFSCKMVQQPI